MHDWQGLRSTPQSLSMDNRSRVWNFFWWENGKRKCKALGRFPTKAAAWKAAKPLRDALETTPQLTSKVPTVSALVEHYRKEKMPKRKDPRRSYEVWVKHYILPRGVSARCLTYKRDCGALG
jgi:hypothetical protein